MKPITVNKQEFVKRIADFRKGDKEWKYLGDRPAVVDFYAAWCGPCKAVAPILEELATEYGDKIYIYKVDTDNERELAAMFDIRSIPTLLFIPMSGVPHIARGALPKSKFKEVIDNVLLSK